MQLRAHRDTLPVQTYKTLRGQVLAGDPDGALKGLRRLLRKKHEEERT